MIISWRSSDSHLRKFHAKPKLNWLSKKKNNKIKRIDSQGHRQQIIKSKLIALWRRNCFKQEKVKSIKRKNIFKTQYNKAINLPKIII